MKNKIENGGRINGIFFRIEVIKEMYNALECWREEYIQRYSSKRRLPYNVKRYIKTMDDKIASAEKIIEEYDRKKRNK